MKPDTAELWHKARLRPRHLWRYRLWRPSHARAALKAQPYDAASATDERHLTAAAEWLARAQDASGDGGVVGRYRFDRGWTSSYSETTGYIVPTFLALATHLDSAFHARAGRCIAFLLGTQLASGAFPGGEIADNTTTPSPFNTAQIVNGLLAWHAATGDVDCLAAARRAGDWLLDVQDADGAWRQWFHRGTAACYSTHLSCWLAELGVATAEPRYGAAAARHLDWVLGHRDTATGWFDHTGFSAAEQTLRIADLHTIAYTLAGLSRSGRLLGRDDALDAVRSAAKAVAATLTDLGWLPGVLDWQWRARADSACLTGNAQMALVWMGLARHDADSAWLAPAHRAIELVKRAQLLDCADPDLRGAIPGSAPIWGWYNDGTLPNWAAKFFIDALLEKAALARPQT